MSIGFAVSLLVGLLFWPRGAAALLRRTTADALAAGAHYADRAIERLVRGGSAAPAAELALEALGAEGRLDVAFRQRLSERPSHDLAIVAITRLVSAATRLRGTGDTMQVLADRIDGASRPAGADVLLGDARGLEDWYAALGRSVTEQVAPPAAEAFDPAVRPALLAAVRDAAAGGSRDRFMAGISVAWGGLHLGYLKRLEDRCAQAAADLAGRSSERPEAATTPAAAEAGRAA